MISLLMVQLHIQFIFWRYQGVTVSDLLVNLKSISTSPFYGLTLDVPLVNQDNDYAAAVFSQLSSNYTNEAGTLIVTIIFHLYLFV